MAGDVTPIQYGLLSILSLTAGLRDQFTLGEELGLDPRQRHRHPQAQRLEARGWVQRVVDAENRAPDNAAPWSRRAARPSSRPTTRRCSSRRRKLLAPLSAAEREQFIALLTRLVEGNNEAAGRTALRRRRRRSAPPTERPVQPPPVTRQGPSAMTRSPTPKAPETVQCADLELDFCGVKFRSTRSSSPRWRPPTAPR
jgi:DNA-binding MarR family transcriptional regulator